eukprot:jgi/Bigna1/89123/estExt_fgenesh1_pg.C_440042
MSMRGGSGGWGSRRYASSSAAYSSSAASYYTYSQQQNNNTASTSTTNGEATVNLSYYGDNSKRSTAPAPVSSSQNAASTISSSRSKWEGKRNKIGRQLSLLCNPVSLERFHQRGIANFVKTYSQIRRYAVETGMKNESDRWISRLLIMRLASANKPPEITIYMKTILATIKTFRGCARCMFQEVAKKINPSENLDQQVACCYLILRLSTYIQATDLQLKVRVVYILVSRFQKFPQQLSATTPPKLYNLIAAMLKVIRTFLTTPCGNMLWSVAIPLNRVLDKLHHPMLRQIQKDIHTRLHGVKELMRGMGTHALLCPAFGISDEYAIRRMCHASTTRKRAQDLNPFIFTVQHLLAESTPIDQIVPDLATVSSQWRTSVCTALVQRILTLIHNSPLRAQRPGANASRRTGALTRDWMVLAGQIHAVIHFNVIDFQELVKRLHQRLKTPGRGVYRDNRIIWLLSQCMTLENAKNAMTESVQQHKGLVLLIEDFHEESILKNLDVVQLHLQSQLGLQNNPGQNHYMNQQQQQQLSSSKRRLDKIMSTVYSLSIQSVLFRIQFLDKNPNSRRFKFRGNAKDVEVDQALVQWWNKKKDFTNVTDMMLVKLSLLSSMSSKEVSNGLLKYLVEKLSAAQIMPGSLFIYKQLRPLPDILLAVLSEGVKKHLQRGIQEQLLGSNSSVGGWSSSSSSGVNSGPPPLEQVGILGQAITYPPSPALVLTFSRLMRSSPLFNIKISKAMMISQVVATEKSQESSASSFSSATISNGNEKWKQQQQQQQKRGQQQRQSSSSGGSGRSISTSVYRAGPKQYLRNVVLEMLSYPLFRLMQHTGQTRQLFEEISVLVHQRLHPQVTLQLQHLLLQMVNRIAFVPGKTTRSREWMLHQLQQKQQQQQQHNNKGVASTTSNLEGKKNYKSSSSSKRRLSSSSGGKDVKMDSASAAGTGVGAGGAVGGRGHEKEAERSSIFLSSGSASTNLSYGILNDRLLFLSFARALLIIRLPRPLRLLRPQQQQQQELLVVQQQQQQQQQQQLLLLGYEFGSSEATRKLDAFLDWFQALPHAKRSFSAHTMRYLPACMRTRLIDRETALRRENEEVKKEQIHRQQQQQKNAKAAAAASASSSSTKSRGRGSSKRKRGSKQQQQQQQQQQQKKMDSAADNGSHSLFRSRRVFTSWEDAEREASTPLMKMLMFGQQRGRGPLEQAHRHYASVTQTERSRFLAGVAHCWVTMDEKRSIGNFREATVLAVLQQFSPADLQLASTAFVDAVLDYVKRDPARNKFRVQNLLWGMAQSGQGPIIPFDHLLLLLSDHATNIAMELALHLLLDPMHMSGLVKRRNKVCQLVAASSPEDVQDGIYMGGLSFQSHLQYHNAFRSEIPAMYQEDGLRVSGADAILAMYHSSEIARVMPAIDVLLWRLLEAEREKDFQEALNMAWPLYRIFHPTPVAFVKEILCYYDTCPALSVKTRHLLLRLIPPPGLSSGDGTKMGGGGGGGKNYSQNKGNSNTPKSSSSSSSSNGAAGGGLSPEWAAILRFLHKAHFSDRKRYDLRQCPLYGVAAGRGSTAAASSGLMSGNEMGGGDEWMSFFNDEEQPNKDDKKDQDDRDDKAVKNNKDEVPGRVLIPPPSQSSSNDEGNASLESSCQRSYLVDIALSIAELMPLQRHTKPGRLLGPECHHASEFISPLNRALSYGLVEILAQNDQKTDPDYRHLSRLFVESFVMFPPKEMHISEKTKNLLQHDPKAISKQTVAESSGGGDGDSVVIDMQRRALQGAGLLISSLPTRLHDSLVDLVERLLLPPIILSALEAKDAAAATTMSPSSSSSSSAAAAGTDEQKHSQNSLASSSSSSSSSSPAAVTAAKTQSLSPSVLLAASKLLRKRTRRRGLCKSSSSTGRTTTTSSAPHGDPSSSSSSLQATVTSSSSAASAIGNGASGEQKMATQQDKKVSTITRRITNAAIGQSDRGGGSRSDVLEAVARKWRSDHLWSSGFSAITRQIREMGVDHRHLQGMQHQQQQAGGTVNNITNTSSNNTGKIVAAVGTVSGRLQNNLSSLSSSPSSLTQQQQQLLPPLEKIFTTALGPIEGGLFTVANKPSSSLASTTTTTTTFSSLPSSTSSSRPITIDIAGDDSKRKGNSTATTAGAASATSRTASPSSTSSFKTPSVTSPLGRLLTLLEACFVWSKPQLFESLCRGLARRLHAGSALHSTPQQQIWAEKSISHVITFIQFLAHGFNRFKSEIGVVETVLRVAYYTLRALNAVVCRQQAAEVLEKTRVMFDFIVFVHSSGVKLVSTATARELDLLINDLHPEWRYVLRCHK